VLLERPGELGIELEEWFVAGTNDPLAPGSDLLPSLEDLLGGHVEGARELRVAVECYSLHCALKVAAAEPEKEARRAAPQAFTLK